MALEKADLHAAGLLIRHIETLRRAFAQAAERARAAKEAAARAEVEAQQSAQKQQVVAYLKEQAKAAESAELKKSLLSQARQVEKAPVVATGVAVESELPPSEGVFDREIWTAEVENFDALLEAAYLGKIPRAAVMPNQAFLNQQATALKEGLAWPGIRPVKKTTTVVRSA